MQNEQNQYDFITNDTKPARSGLLPAVSSKKQRIMIAAGGALVLIVLITVAIAVISNIGKGNTEQLVRLAQQHAEIARIAEIGEDKAVGPDARNLAVTTKLALQSSQADLLSTIGKTRKISNKELEAGMNSETDQELTAAEQNNRFDEAFTETLLTQLTEYRQELGVAFEGTNSQSSREVYGGIYKQLTALLPEED